jgi:hypothetical protein
MILHPPIQADFVHKVLMIQCLAVLSHYHRQCNVSELHQDAHHEYEMQRQETYSNGQHQLAESKL